jgi:uncharacterized coiled-coil protein SlyX
MDVQSVVEFSSKLCPGAKFRIRKLTWSARQRVIQIRRQLNLQEDVPNIDFMLEVMKVNGEIWNVMVASSNVTLDGKELTVQEMYETLPEDLVGEVLEELDQMVTPLAKTDDPEQVEIDSLTKRIDAARERMAERKNSEQLSTQPPTGSLGTVPTVETAASEGSKPAESETAPVIPTSNEP